MPELLVFGPRGLALVHPASSAQVMAQGASVDMTYAYGTFLTTMTGVSYT